MPARDLGEFGYPTVFLDTAKVSLVSGPFEMDATRVAPAYLRVSFVIDGNPFKLDYELEQREMADTAAIVDGGRILGHLPALRRAHQLL